MNPKLTDIEILSAYRKADPSGRLRIMMDNYSIFPKVIRKVEKKTLYMIRMEQESRRHHSFEELGVRVQTSHISNPTFREAIANLTIEEAMKTGKIDREMLEGMEDARRYEEDIKTISVMNMDYELLTEIIEGLEDEDSKIMKQRLLEHRTVKDIAVSEGRSYETIKKRLEIIRLQIKEEIIECLEMSCRGIKL